MQETSTINSRIKAIREALELNQSEFAARLGVSPASISELEKGKFKPKYDLLKSLMQEFNTNLYYLFTGIGSKFSEGESPAKLQDLLNHSEIGSELLLRFLTDMRRSPFLTLAILTHYKTLLKTEKTIIESDFAEYDQNHSKDSESKDE